jgi:hypothetical protein
MLDARGDGVVAKDEFKVTIAAFIRNKGGKPIDIDALCDDFYSSVGRADTVITFSDFQEGVKKNPDIMKVLSVL